MLSLLISKGSITCTEMRSGYKDKDKVKESNKMIIVENCSILSNLNFFRLDLVEVGRDVVESKE